MMRQVMWILCIFLGGLLIGSASFLQDAGQISRPAYAQEEASSPSGPKSFVGSQECISCHRDIGRPHNETRHARSLFRPADFPEGVLGDFSLAPEVTLPDGQTRRPNLEDVALVLGSGRYIQRYLSQTEAGDYALLPLEWNVSTASWQAYDPAGADFAADCAACHTSAYQSDSGQWLDEGVKCEACHGAGSAHLELADAAGNRASDEEIVAIRAAVVSGADPQICGACHLQGGEGEAPFAMGYQVGGDLSEVLVVEVPQDSAHFFGPAPIHALGTQYNSWAGSGHAAALTTLRESDLAQNACMTCHSSDYARTEAYREGVAAGDLAGPAPERLTLSQAQYGVTCLACHDPHAEGPSEFYMTQDAYTQCVACHSGPTFSLEQGFHAISQQMFEGQTVVAEVPGIPSGHFMSLSAGEGGPDCAACHMPRLPGPGFSLASHSFNILAPEEALSQGLMDTCSACHSEQADPLALGQLMSDIQSANEARLGALRSAMTGGEAEWVKTALAFLEADSSRGIHNPLYTEALLQAIEAEVLAQ